MWSPAKKQRIGDFVKITLDIAKQSTDFGNLLKAALAGVCALVEHYEVILVLWLPPTTDVDGHRDSKVSRRRLKVSFPS